jgi:hypothetical protein
VQLRRLTILVLAIATTLLSTLSFAQSSCPQGTVSCGAVCSNIQSDPKHCGNCADACMPGDACTSGRCSCPAPKVICGVGPLAVCVNESTNPNHCGTCGTACAAGHVCTSGRCS